MYPKDIDIEESCVTRSSDVNRVQTPWVGVFENI